MNFFKIPPTSLSFLRGLVLANKSTHPLTSMAAAHVLSQHALLPPQQVGSPAAFFLSESGESMCQFLDSINDVVPINHAKISDYAKKFYQVRYANALGCCNPTVTGSNGIYNLFHIGVHFSGEELELLEDEDQAFPGLVAGFETIYKSSVQTAAVAI